MQKQVLKIVDSAICLVLALGLQATAQLLEEEAEPLEHPALLTGGAAGGGGTDVFSGNVMIPHWLTELDVLFFNPSATRSDDQDYFNLGAGYRHWLPGIQGILGANLFYDSYETGRNNTFERVGAGFEFLSPWTDARANFYVSLDDKEAFDSFPVETILSSRTSVSDGDPYASGHDILQDSTQTVRAQTLQENFGVFEVPLEGFDFEIGGWLPFLKKLPVEVGAFGGYYRYGESFGDSDFDGFRGRLEVRGLPGLIFDAQVFSDDALFGTDYLIGGRLQLPLDFGALFGGRHPFGGVGAAFKPGKAPFGWRLVDNVVRQPRVGIVEATRKTSESVGEKVERSRTRRVLLADVQFVNNENDTGREDGSFKYPYDTIQEGVDGATGRKNVYVFSGDEYYSENVVLSSGVKVTGQGFPVFGFGGNSFPTVDGQSMGPAITLADNTVVRGMRIINTDLGGPAQPVTIGGEIYDISRVGVYGKDANNVRLTRNKVEGSSFGALLGADQTENFSTLVAGNTFRGNLEDGLHVQGQGMSGTFNFVSVFNTYVDSVGDGVEIQAWDYDEANIWFIADRVNYNLEDGIDLGDCDGNDRLTINMLCVEASHNGFGELGGEEDWNHGIDMSYMSVGEGGFQGNVFGVRASDNAGSGIELGVGSDGPVMAAFHYVTVERNELAGLRVDALSFAGMDLFFTDIMANDNMSQAGDGVEVMAFATESMSSVFERVTADGNGGSGIAMLLSSEQNVDLSMSEVGASRNANFGAFVDIGATGNVTARFSDMIVNDNGADGLRTDLRSLDGAVAATYERIVASGNGGSGIRISALSLADQEGPGLPLPVGEPGDVAVYGSGIVARENDGDGVTIEENAGGMRVWYDFGGGELGSPGGCTFTDNEDYGMANYSGVNAFAQSNFWGNVPPIPNVDYTDPGVDASNPLGVNPNL